MNHTLKVYEQDILHEVAPNLFGIFLEDINFSIDGGLNANMLNNYSFDSFYPPKGSSMMTDLLFKQKFRPVYDRLRFWDITGNVASCNDRAVSSSAYFARITGSAVLKNKGHNGGGKFRNEPAISIEAGTGYEVSVCIRSIDFSGKVTVWAEDPTGKALTGTAEIGFTREWTKQTVQLYGTGTGYGSFVLRAEGAGMLDIDQLFFARDDYWGKGDPRYNCGGKFRRDLVEMLRDIHPKFMRFPGGGLVGGVQDNTEYEWKDTVGLLSERKGQVNAPWGLNQSGYFQSYQIGFYELLCLCEDLHMEPVPVLWIGLTGRGQFITHKGLEIGSAEYQERVVQNYLDLIEFCNGEKGSGKWADLRCSMGHETPFNIHTLGIGNENTGDYYTRSFIEIEKAIHKTYPGMQLIMSTGSYYDSKTCHKQWADAVKHNLHCLMDGHTYSSPEWFRNSTHLFDDRDRSGNHLFLGEYAAGNSYAGNCKHPNSYESALAEAAFMTGIERNSDYVDMACYAPLFALIGGTQWRHNLIEFSQKQPVHSTNYLVQKMYGSTSGNVVYRTSFTDEDGLYTSAVGNGDLCHIRLINTADHPASVSIEVDPQYQQRVAAAYIQSDDLSVRNEVDFYGNVREPIRMQTKELRCENGKLEVEMEKYSFYVLTLSR